MGMMLMMTMTMLMTLTMMMVIVQHLCTYTEKKKMKTTAVMKVEDFVETHLPWQAVCDSSVSRVLRGLRGTKSVYEYIIRVACRTTHPLDDYQNLFPLKPGRVVVHTTGMAGLEGPRRGLSTDTSLCVCALCPCGR